MCVKACRKQVVVGRPRAAHRRQLRCTAGTVATTFVARALYLLVLQIGQGLGTLHGAHYARRFQPATRSQLGREEGHGLAGHASAAWTFRCSKM